MILLSAAATRWGHVGLWGGWSATMLIRVLLVRMQMVVVNHDRNGTRWPTLLSGSHALEKPNGQNTTHKTISANLISRCLMM